MWNDSVIYIGTNLEPLSLVINESCGDYKFTRDNETKKHPFNHMKYKQSMK